MGNKMNAGMYSSEKDTWYTPDRLYQNLNKKFGPFSLDACANEESNKCENYFTLPHLDTLAQEAWMYGKCWMNPPYGNQIYAFMEWAYKQSVKGCTFTCLVPARIDTGWWSDWIWDQSCHVYFIKGRIKFVESSEGRAARIEKNKQRVIEGKKPKKGPDSAGFPSAVIHYDPSFPQVGRPKWGRMTVHGTILQEAC